MASYSGLWNNEYGENYSQLPHGVSQGNELTALSKAFANRIYGRGIIRELMTTLMGTVPGSTALSSHKRIRAERDLESNVLGGDRVIETFVGVNRVTTSNDVAAINSALEMKFAPSPFPVDRSGNGGGNKLGW